jgi:plastocyanin
MPTPAPNVILHNTTLIDRNGHDPRPGTSADVVEGPALIQGGRLMRTLKVCSLLLSAALLTMAAACGGDDDDDGGGDQTAAATSPAGGAATSAGGGEVTFVEADAFDFGFEPSSLSVAAGTELTFAIANTGAAPHTFTLYADDGYEEPVDGADTGNMPDGTVGEFTVTLEAGDYFFRCELHPTQMEGALTAE